MINCLNGIGLLLINTKEIVQYIKIESNSFEKQITLDDNNNLVYLLTMDKIQNKRHFYISIYKINNNSFDDMKKLKDVDIDSSTVNEDYKILCSNNNIIYYKDHLHCKIKKDRYVRLSGSYYESLVYPFAPFHYFGDFEDFDDFEDSVDFDRIDDFIFYDFEH